MKAYIYPHFYCWIDYGVGPAIDIKPYGRATFGYGTQIGVSADSLYATTTADGYVGADWAVGISTPVEGYFYEKDATMKQLGNLFKEYRFMKSPSGLVMETNPGEIKAGNETELNFVVTGEFWGKTAASYIPSIINLYFPKSAPESGYMPLIPILGKATYKWTPEFEGDILEAKVFDIDGKVVGMQTFTAGKGDDVRVTTGTETAVDAHSAKIVSKVESTLPITQRGVVYSKTSTVPALGGKDNIKVLSMDNTDVFEVTLSELENAMTYHVRAFVIYMKDGMQKVRYGNAIDVTTGTWGLCFVSGHVGKPCSYRLHGRSVRPVSE